MQSGSMQCSRVDHRGPKRPPDWPSQLQIRSANQHDRGPPVLRALGGGSSRQNTTKTQWRRLLQIPKSFRHHPSPSPWSWLAILRPSLRRMRARPPIFAHQSISTSLALYSGSIEALGPASQSRPASRIAEAPCAALDPSYLKHRTADTPLLPVRYRYVTLYLKSWTA